MKKFNKTIVVLMVGMLLCMFISSCQDEPLGVADIDYSLPEITRISSGVDKMLAGAETSVSVEANQGSSYSWSADHGSFTDASSASTTWSSEGMDTSAPVKLKCTVSNSSGSRFATVTVQVVVPTPITYHWPFDSDFNDAVGGNHGVAGTEVSISTEDPRLGAGCAEFPGGDETTEDIVMTLTDDAGFAMGPEDEFTITIWMKTESEGANVYGRATDLAEFDWEGDKTLLINPDYGFFGYWAQGWRPGAIEYELGQSDGEWHHVAITHMYDGEDTYQLFFDGEFITEGGVDYGATIPDDGQTFYLGGIGFPGPYEGFIDDMRYYSEALGEAEIALLAVE